MQVARCVFKNETQRYVLCPYCHQIHVHAMEHGTIDRPANCEEGQDGNLTYTIAGNYSLREIGLALASRNKMVDRKRKTYEKEAARIKEDILRVKRHINGEN